MDINSAKKLLHQRDVEILVVGGGPSGVGAGFAAARLGRKVLIVDQFNCLGGVATAGGHGHMCILCAWADTARVVGGIPYEVSKRITDEGFGRLTPHGVYFEVDALKYLYDRMAKECGAELLYHTFFCEPIMDGQTVCGAVVQNKTGRCAIFAQRVIDCTGDGDVAAGAGAPFEIGRPSDQRCQPGTLMFTVGGVEWERVEEWRKADRQGKATWKLAQDNGDMDPFQTVIMGFWWTHTRPDQVGINFTHITKLDSTKAEDITSATIEGRRQAFQCINVFRKYVPGMEKCHMVSTPTTLGLRESRRIVGDLVLTEADMLAHREWEDSIGYGSFFIDIHNLDGPGMSEKVVKPEPGFRYQIPYRILQPRNVENLLVAGRCVSVTHIALGSIRVMVQCMLMGEAAGTASALSLDLNVPSSKVPIAVLQSELRKHGAILNEADIHTANNPNKE